MTHQMTTTLPRGNEQIFSHVLNSSMYIITNSKQHSIEKTLTSDIIYSFKGLT